MRPAAQLILLSLCAASAGCGLLPGYARSVALGRQRPSSAPVEDRAAWREYAIRCGNETMVFKSPHSLRHPPYLIRRIPADWDTPIMTVYDQGFDVEFGDGMFPGFEIEVVILRSAPSDPLRNDPAILGEKYIAETGRDTTVYHVVSRSDREWLVTRGYSDRERKYLMASDYEAIVGGHHIRLQFVYRHGYYGDYEEWSASRRKIEEDVWASLRVLPAE